jgi:hypothetical protein
MGENQMATPKLAEVLAAYILDKSQPTNERQLASRMLQTIVPEYPDLDQLGCLREMIGLEFETNPEFEPIGGGYYQTRTTMPQ